MVEIAVYKLGGKDTDLINGCGITIFLCVKE